MPLRIFITYIDLQFKVIGSNTELRVFKNEMGQCFFNACFEHKSCGFT